MNETVSGYGAAVAVNVFGNDLDQLDREAAQIARILAATPGGTEVQLQSPPGMPEILVRLRKDGIARWGFDPLSVLDVVRTAYGREVVGQTSEGNPVFYVSFLLASSRRPQVSELGALPLRNPDGKFIALSGPADLQESACRYFALHERLRRVQTI